MPEKIKLCQTVSKIHPIELEKLSEPHPYHIIFVILAVPKNRKPKNRNYRKKIEQLVLLFISFRNEGLKYYSSTSKLRYFELKNPRKYELNWKILYCSRRLPAVFQRKSALFGVETALFQWKSELSSADFAARKMIFYCLSEMTQRCPEILRNLQCWDRNATTLVVLIISKSEVISADIPDTYQFHLVNGTFQIKTQKF